MTDLHMPSTPLNLKKENRNVGFDKRLKWQEMQTIKKKTSQKNNDRDWATLTIRQTSISIHSQKESRA